MTAAVQCRSQHPRADPLSLPYSIRGSMAMNTAKIVTGGLVSGLVLNVFGFLINGLLLGKRMMDEMVAVAPTLQGRGMSGGVLTARVLTSFIVGTLIVWLYAAIRPRFGPGMRTATYAGLIAWCFGFLFYLDWLYVDLMTPVSYAMVSIAQLVAVLVAAWAGGMVYSEQAAPAI
jgi:hypothetical protein